MIYTTEFWKDTFERTLYTCVECLLGAMAGTSLITQLDWKIVLTTTLSAGVITVLKCLALALKGGSDENN